jgi:hypothetical protein
MLRIGGSMKRNMLIGVAFLLLFSSIGYAKKEKTITRQDSLVTDVKYNYSFVVNDNWKVKDSNEPSIERAYLEKKNYSVNREAKAFGGDYTVPTIVFFAQEFGGTAEDFEALLKKSLEEHSSDNEIVRKLGLMRDTDFITSSDIVIDSHPVRQIFMKRNYKRLLSSDSYNTGSDPTQQTERFINDHEVHELFLIKKDNILIVMQAYCEREFYAKENKDEFEAISKSLKF